MSTVVCLWIDSTGQINFAPFFNCIFINFQKGLYNKNQLADILFVAELT